MREVNSNVERCGPFDETAQGKRRMRIDAPRVNEFLLSTVPIRSLSETHRVAITCHLLDLDEQDRYLRFGYFASDDQIRRYADGLNFERDEVFGIFNRKLRLIAVAHLAFSSERRQPYCAEFGVSVNKQARGRGYGARLFERAAMDAQNKRVELMFIHALSENTAMLAIARNAGAAIERHGSESEAFLRLPHASLNSRLAEIVEEHCAQIDYHFKAHSKQLSDFLAAFRLVHRGRQAEKFDSII